MIILFNNFLLSFSFYNFVELLLNVYALQLILSLIYSFMKLFLSPPPLPSGWFWFFFAFMSVLNYRAVIVNFENKHINFVCLFLLASFLLEHVHFFLFVFWEIYLIFSLSSCYHILILVTAV